MDTFIRLIEAEVHNALRGARIIGMVHVEHIVKDGYTQYHGPQRQPDPVQYIEDAYIVAWERDGEHSNFGTHRAAVNNGGEVMLVWGHYDIPSKADTLKDMLERAYVKPLKHDGTETYIQLVIDEECFVSEESGNAVGGKEGVEFTDADLVSMGKEANDIASHWLGYSGWRAVRGERFIFDPEETRTGF